MSRFLACVATGGLALGFACVAAGQDVASVSREDALKAAYLFNFTKFVDWPGQAEDTSLTMCFMGGGAVRQAVANDLANKRIGSHPIRVRAIATWQDLGDCNVLYLEVAAGGAAPPAVDAHAPVLTVSNGTGFARKGGIIEIFTEGNRLRFIVNVANAKRAGIKISSSLLQLASVVEKDNEP